ncbi:MAG: 2-amino-4-hydroxy-6-hydroxymethyldihydropteridine diphosphokinase [Gammaproteobacteria bacterium]|nr:2-amino-4-hydroxy-6-hydroxymethyldihydropteridine diphosphokinase [Gammaproteobacteria bacterium]
MSEQTAYIGIGSNLNDPVAQVRAACNALALIPETRLLAASSLYSNPPMGPQDQPDYVNAVAALHTRLSPRDLLSALLAAELAAGRDRNKFEHWGPRVLDLDLLVHGSKRVDEPDLKVPHPGIAERSFVLLPLLEIAPDLDIFGVGKVVDLAKAMNPADLHVIG